MANHWIGTLEQVRLVRLHEADALELGRGRAADVAGLMPGDGVVIYCPRESRISVENIEAFCAIGRVTGYLPFKAEIAPGVERHRITMRWAPITRAVSFDELSAMADGLSRLNKRVMRQTRIAISEEEFHALASEMGAVPPI